MRHVRKDILNGWKEIGGYVSRDTRTVERWEKQRGLPVRRVPGAGRATVYAVISEVDEWLAGTKILEQEETDSSQSGPFPIQATAEATESGRADLRVEGLPLPVPLLPSFQPVSQPKVIAPRLSPWANLVTRLDWRAAIAIVTVVAVSATIAGLHLLNQEKRRTAGSKPLDSMRILPYQSKVPGVDELCLNGVYSYEQRTPASLQHSYDDFVQAIAKDPNYAPAYAGLANTYNLMREYSHMPENEAYTKAKEAAEHAILLDPKLPQAHAALGFIDFFWEWDARKAEEEFQTSLSLDPYSGPTRHWYGSMLAHEGRFAEAVDQLDQARRLDTTSTAIFSTRALAWGLEGHRDEAVQQLKTVIAQAPTANSPHAILAILSLVAPRNPEQFLKESRIGANARDDRETLAQLDAGERGLQTGGEPGMWRAMLDTAQRQHPGPRDRTYIMVEAEAALGKNDAALADLLQLVQRHQPAAIGIMLDPLFTNLHNDPRCAELLSEMGLPPELANQRR